MPSREPQAEPRRRRRDRDALVALARNAVHAGALVFAAFWLMATSTVEDSGWICYQGVEPADVLRVEAGRSAGAATTTCGGIDGLMDGAILLIQLGAAAQQTTCNSFSTLTLSGTAGVTLTSDEGAAQRNELVFATGTFQSQAVPGCRGTWRLTLAPVADPLAGPILSPLDASPTQPWVVTRSIVEMSGGACAALFPTSGRQPAICKDTFEVASISKGTP